MKNLNLAAYGVAEMNRQEMKAAEGGVALIIGIMVAAVAAYCIPFVYKAVQNYQNQKRYESWSRNEAAKWKG
jgi:NADH:ubiquinone oxidoreductase subunit 2 (subunit N)